MSHIVKVDGIEMFCGARGHALECDNCNEHYDGGNHEDKGGPYKPTGYRSVGTHELVQDGILLGWAGLEKYLHPEKIQGKAAPDLCPVCAAMKGAPYWPILVHEPSGIALIIYQTKGPLLQRHTVVRPLENGPFGINTTGWPIRDRYNEAPAVLEVKFTANETGSNGIYFEGDVRWPERKRGEAFKSKAPLIRLWSWGDGKVYAKEIIQTIK